MSDYSDLNEIRRIFTEGVQEIRNLERECEIHASYFRENEKTTVKKVHDIVEKR